MAVVHYCECLHGTRLLLWGGWESFEGQKSPNSNCKVETGSSLTELTKVVSRGGLDKRLALAGEWLCWVSDLFPFHSLGCLETAKVL